MIALFRARRNCAIAISNYGRHTDSSFLERWRHRIQVLLGDVLLEKCDMRVVCLIERESLRHLIAQALVPLIRRCEHSLVRLQEHVYSDEFVLSGCIHDALPGLLQKSNSLENSGKENPKIGFKPPRAEEKIRRATICHTLSSILHRNLTFLWRMGWNALRRSAGKLLPVDIYERADHARGCKGLFRTGSSW